jgi:hypothetical protein
MKKSAQVTLTLAAAMALAGCGRRYDPCEAQAFNEQACQQAIQDRGYYYHGTWFPMYYSRPYPYYYDSYRGYLSRGGSVSGAPAGSYSHPAGVERGGFGAHGAGHAAGGE